MNNTTDIGHMITCVNGIDIHYEVSGNGPPIILLHGNGEDISIFDVLTEQLKDDFTVYSLDTRGHGGSGGVEEYHYADIMEDVAKFINALNINKPIVYGFSDGGIVGMMLASKYPDLLSKLVASGVNLHPKDVKWSFRTHISVTNFFKKDPLLELMLNEPNITDDDLAKISIPVLLTVGEKDIVSVKYEKSIAEKLRNGTILVISKETHSSYIVHSEKLYPLIIGFLKNDDR